MSYQRSVGCHGRSGAAAWTMAIVLPASIRHVGAATAVVAALVLAGSANGQCDPVELGFLDTPDLAIGVAVSGGLAYVADRSSGLRVIDVSAPANPVELGFLDTPGFANGVAVSGGVAYVAAHFSGLRVIDVSSCVACPADLDGSGDVDFNDLLRVLDAWGNKGGPEDLDGSGTVDFGDLLIVLDSWGPCE